MGALLHVCAACVHMPECKCACIRVRMHAGFMCRRLCTQVGLSIHNTACPMLLRVHMHMTCHIQAHISANMQESLFSIEHPYG